MIVKNAALSRLRGNWSGKLSVFESFDEMVAHVARAAAEAAPSPLSPSAARKLTAGMGGPIGAALAPQLNSRSEIRVGERTYRLDRPADLAAFIQGMQGSYEALHQVQGLVEDIMCQLWSQTKPVCVSVNTDTHLPSFAYAHVERWEDSSYITRYFDTQANGRLTRIQLWKGHLRGLGMSGAEISVWKPETRRVLKRTGFLRWEWVDEEYFGTFWWPYPANQLTISWDLIDRDGRVVQSYGKLPGYEQEAKWWAGKWTAAPDPQASKRGEDYRISYQIRDAQGLVAQGQGAW